MSRTQRRLEDDENERSLRFLNRNRDNRENYLQPGERYRVPLHMIDASTVTIGGSGSDGPLALQKPGYRTITAIDDLTVVEARAEAKAQYQLYDAEIQDAWRNGNPPTGFGSRNFSGQKEGDLCTINGRPGRLRYDDETGELTCMADHPGGERDARTLDQLIQDHRLRMVEEYDAYDRALSEAWRSPR